MIQVKSRTIADMPRFSSAVRWFLGALALTVTAYAVGRLALQPSMIRVLVFGVLLLFTLGLGVRSPSHAMFFLLLYEPFLGFVRRILIPIAGWESLDPLVILEPLMVLLLGSYWFYRMYFIRDSLTQEPDTRIFRLLRWMILIDILEIFNPEQGGLTVGYGGLIFYVVPLFWMIISREHFNETWLRRVVSFSFAIGIVAALYGLKQTYWGYYPFEETWIKSVGIVSMTVNGVVRAVSVMTNAQEYSEYLGVAMIFGWFYVLRGRWAVKVIAFSGVGIVGWALFMESVRGTIVTTALGIAMMTLFSARRLSSRLGLFFILGGALTAVFIGLSHVQSANGLITHNIEGLTNPLNGQDSSLGGHLSMMWNGILEGLKNPLGFGLGSTTTAAGKFSGGNLGTEVDISNMFVSDGVVGGILYLALIWNVILKAFRQAHQRLALGIISVGVLCTVAGQWMNGELYSVAALVWIIVGQLDRSRELAPIHRKGETG